ncbi:hypothetical protein EMIT0P100_300019 [Pseudomonas sp. IT-P100]
MDGGIVYVRRLRALLGLPAPGDSHTSGQRLVPEPARHDALGLGHVQRTVVMANDVRHGSVRGRHLDGGSVGGSAGLAVKLMDVAGQKMLLPTDCNRLWIQPIDATHLNSV